MLRKSGTHYIPLRKTHTHTRALAHTHTHSRTQTHTHTHTHGSGDFTTPVGEVKVQSLIRRLCVIKRKRGACVGCRHAMYVSYQELNGSRGHGGAVRDGHWKSDTDELKEFGTVQEP